MRKLVALLELSEVNRILDNQIVKFLSFVILMLHLVELRLGTYISHCHCTHLSFSDTLIIEKYIKDFMGDSIKLVKI